MSRARRLRCRNGPDETGRTWFRRVARRCWEWKKGLAFPRGAVTFHLRTWAQGRLAPADHDQCLSLMDRFGFRRLFVLHGSAITVSGRLCVVVGPAGIGKSSVLRVIERSGEGRLIEDGVVLIGERDGSLAVVATGTLGVMQTAGRIATTVRRLTFTNTSVFNRPPGPRPVTRSATHRVLRRLATVSFHLAAMTRVSFATFTPQAHPLDRVVLGSHRDDDGPNVVIDQLGQVTAIRDLGSMMPDSTSLIEFSPVGPRPEVMHRIRLAMVEPQSEKACGSPSLDPSRRGCEGAEQGDVRR